jgi:hypothetical protein
MQLPNRRLLARFAAAALLGSAGCEDERTPTGTESATGIHLVAPLTLDWTGKDSGVPFLYDGVFHARAAMRASWDFRLEARPADPDDPRFGWRNGLGPPLYKQTVTFQEELLFSWNIGSVFAGRNPFALGDTCTATVKLRPALAAGEEAKAVLTFVIGDAAGGEAAGDPQADTEGAGGAMERDPEAPG